MIRLALYALLFVDVAALNAYVLAEVGYVEFWKVIFSSWAGILAVVDLSIAVSLILAWMWNDARERGLPFLPYAALGVALGSLGPLGYLIHRELRAVRAARAVPGVAVRRASA